MTPKKVLFQPDIEKRSPTNMEDTLTTDIVRKPFHNVFGSGSAESPISHLVRTTTAAPRLPQILMFRR